MDVYTLLTIISISTIGLAQMMPLPNGIRDPSLSTFGSLFGAAGFGRRGQHPIMQNGGFQDDYYDMMPMSMPFPQNRMMPMQGPQMPMQIPFGSPDPVAMASLMSYVTDKDNFQPQGCGFDGIRNRCTDGLNLCKGGCRDFSNDVTHDCRCIPFGYMALLGGLG